MTPLASVAILEKLALLNIALCRASAPSACSPTRIFSGFSMFSDPGDCGRAAKIGNVDDLGLMTAGRSCRCECLFGRCDQITRNGADSGSPCGRARKVTASAARQQRDSAPALRALRNLQRVNPIDRALRNSADPLTVGVWEQQRKSAARIAAQQVRGAPCGRTQNVGD